jgi:hypothetical protein
LKFPSFGQPSIAYVKVNEMIAAIDFRLLPYRDLTCSLATTLRKSLELPRVNPGTCHFSVYNGQFGSTRVCIVAGQARILERIEHWARFARNAQLRIRIKRLST